MPLHLVYTHTCLGFQIQRVGQTPTSSMTGPKSQILPSPTVWSLPSVPTSLSSRTKPTATNKPSYTPPGANAKTPVWPPSRAETPPAPRRAGPTAEREIGLLGLL
ncbi:hypothetical protein BJV78DRAFT_1266694, partial [Lactifluus subvellereus]